MLTFLEFYSTLVEFVNYKLYHMLGVAYPPVVDPLMEQVCLLPCHVCCCDVLLNPAHDIKRWHCTCKLSLFIHTIMRLLLLASSGIPVQQVSL